MSRRARLFHCCCPEDEPAGAKFANHLAPLARILEAEGISQILAGEDIAAQWDDGIQWADIIVLLISADFVAMPRYRELIDKARKRLAPARIVPVLLRAVSGTGELDGLQTLPSNGKAVTSWDNHDEAWVDVVDGIRRLAESLDLKATPAQVWKMPAPSAFFTGREAQVAALRQALLKERRAAVGQVQAVSGLGGIGKTQLALEYARRYKGEYDAGFFLRAESLHGALGEMARALGLPEMQPAELERAVLDWLKEYGPWLLVLDNADTSEALAAIKPLCDVHGQGHVIVTTRLRNTAAIGIAKPLRLHQLEPADSQRFLLQRTDREEAGAAELAAAAEVAAELDHLPLALEQAGAYIKKREMLFSRYLGAFRLRQMELLKERPVAGDHPDPVATTWAMNMQQVREASSISAVVMELSAFLHPDAIPEELLLEGCAKLGPELAEALSGPTGELALDDSLAPLLEYSLIERQPEQRTYSIHRLVQQVIRGNLGEPAERQWAERVVRALNAVFPSPEYQNWGQCRRLVEQAKTAFALIVRWDLAYLEAARLLNQAAWYLDDQAQYEEAEPLYQRALAIREKALGPHHPDVALSLNNLAALYYAQGNYAEAEPLYQRALAIWEKALDPDHPDVAASLNNLAILYRAQSKYAEAEPLYQRALAIKEKALPPDHPDVALSLNNLATLYYDQGNYAEAEPLYQRALAIREKALPPDHPHVAQSLDNLANLYEAQGRQADAQQLRLRIHPRHAK